MGKELRFINSNAAPPNVPTGWRNFIGVCREVWTLLAIFGGVTLVCAALFYLGTPHGWGIQPTFLTGHVERGAATVSFLDCLHFSVVTIATLGYGDFRPESYGRIIAAAEVVVGIVLMGVFVSRLVSRQQARMVKRILRGQLNAEIQNFRDQLTNLLEACGKRVPPLEKAVRSSVLYRARGLAMAIARYWRHEAKEPDLSSVLPLRATGRLLGEMIDVLEAVAACCEGKVSSELHFDDLKAVRGITESVLAIATALTVRVADDGIKHSHARVVILVTNLRKQLQLHRI